MMPPYEARPAESTYLAHDRRQALSTWQLRIARSMVPSPVPPRVHTTMAPEPGTWDARPLPAVILPSPAVSGPSEDAPDAGDSWTSALHRNTPVSPSPTLVALRTLAVEAPLDAVRIHRILEQKQKDRRPADEASIAASLTQMTPAAYEALIADLFRREGYEVLAGEGPDADVIDLEVHKSHRRYLVNCQIRGVIDIDLEPLIEMAKVVKANGANGAFVIADGEFRSDAHGYAWSNGVVLIDRPLLHNMVIELTLEDLRKEGLGSKLTRSLHPDRGHELRHAVLKGGSQGHKARASA